MSFIPNMPLWYRQLWEATKQITGYELVPEAAESFPDYFDNTKGIGDVARPKFYKHKGSGIYLPYKGRPGDVDVSTKVGIEVHQMACTFGTSKARRKFWYQRIVAEDIGQPTLDMYLNADGVYEIQSEEQRVELFQKACARMALHERFWKVPYHYAALLNGDVLYNNSIGRYTYHGNGGNGPLVGVALEGHFPGLEIKRKGRHTLGSDWVIETGRAAFTLAVNKSREEGAPIEIVLPHRCYSGDRTGDCGEFAWKEIVLPCAKLLHLTPKYNFRHGSGKPICREWDDNALYDYRGRRLDLAA